MSSWRWFFDEFALHFTGVCFGYNTLVSDMPALEVMKRTVTDQPSRDARREESCLGYPRVFLKAAGVSSSSGRSKTSRWVPRRSKAQAR